MKTVGKCNVDENGSEQTLVKRRDAASQRFLKGH